MHAPQQGRALVAGYLAAAMDVFGNPDFRYVREIVGEREAALEFETRIDGVHVNGIDLVRWNEDGRIVDFKVMIRPLKAIELIHQLMAQRLAEAGKGRDSAPPA